jgi:hypothetical protein
VNVACEYASTPRGPVVRADTRKIGENGVDTVEQREQVSGERELATTQWVSVAGSSSEHSRSIT